MASAAGAESLRCLACTGMLLILLSQASIATGRDLVVSAGHGAQPGSEQFNRTKSIDLNFYRYERSARQHIEIGVAYTQIATNASSDTELYAISVYPQLTFYPAQESRISEGLPSWAEPYFFVRALGPTYISANRLGNRQQANNFAFLAQVGVGLLLDVSEATKVNVGVSWKHFSNANLFSENDGFDVPLVISVGVRF